jgi:hypothetical protein
MTADPATRDQMLAMEAFRRFAVGSVAAFNTLPQAIDGSLHAHESQENVDRLALDAGHVDGCVDRTSQEEGLAPARPIQATAGASPLPDSFYSVVPSCFLWLRNIGGAVTLSGTCTRLCCLNFTIAWRRSRYQRVEQLCRGLCYLFDRAVESLLVCLRRLCKSTQFPYELQRRSTNLFFGRRRFEVMKRFDISTHAVLLPPALKSLR